MLFVLESGVPSIAKYVRLPVDASATDCTTDSCTAGVCVSTNVTDCAACGATSSETCVSGLCGGASFRAVDFESAFPSDFSAPGSYGWSRTTAEQHGGEAGAANADIGNSQTATMRATVEVGASATISFWYKVSSEPWYDRLRFFVDGTEVSACGSYPCAAWSGTVPWTEYTGALTAGTHTLEWCTCRLPLCMRACKTSRSCPQSCSQSSPCSSGTHTQQACTCGLPSCR